MLSELCRASIVQAMSRYDFCAHRMFVEGPLAAGALVLCTPAQTNHLRNVLRLNRGDGVLLFNGRDGEWRAQIAGGGKRGAELEVREQARQQDGGPDIDYLFAPLKRARLDYLVEKATEMGAARICPVITRRTTPERVNLERMRANVIGATEQCGILRVPSVHEPERLERVLAGWDPSRALVFCDEDAQPGDPVATLAPLRSRPIAVLVGPEGGFDPAERELLQRLPQSVSLSLGPRILRADTAAVAALALVNALAGERQ
jgi:16S rRNA (uracil1498-N3)-methyltransferase